MDTAHISLIFIILARFESAFEARSYDIQIIKIRKMFNIIISNYQKY